MTTATLDRPGLAAGAVRPFRTKKPWGVYGRISKITRGDGGGATIKIEDQHAEGAEYVEMVDPGAPVIFYADNLSAYKPGVYRDGFESMMKAVRAGELAGIVAVHADRYVRSVLDQEIMWRDCWNSKPRTQLHITVIGRVKDPGQMQQMAVDAERESRIKSQRARRHHKRLAKAGKIPGGRRRFGYENKLTAIREWEAAEIRDWAKRVLNGESLTSIARDLTARNVPTVRGGKWTPNAVGAILRRPDLAKIRTHSHEDEDTGEIVHTSHDATWAAPAIISRETHESLTHLLNSPERRTNHGTGRAEYLLTGLATCGVCGAGVRSGRGGTVYTCGTGVHVQRAMPAVNEVVEAEIVAWLAGITPTGNPEDETLTGLESAHAAVSANYDADAARHKRGEISDRRWDKDSAAYDAELDRLEAAIAEARESARAPETVLEGLTGEDATLEAWKAAGLPRQRAVIRYLLKRFGATITVTSAGKNRHRVWEPWEMVSVDSPAR